MLKQNQIIRMSLGVENHNNYVIHKCILKINKYVEFVYPWSLPAPLIIPSKEFLSSV